LRQSHEYSSSSRLDTAQEKKLHEALDYGNDCPQADGGDVPLFASWVNDRPRSEDCLFLNVWTRGIGDGGKRPIMVWLHGGGYLAGSGSSHGYDGVRLVTRGGQGGITARSRFIRAATASGQWLDHRTSAARALITRGWRERHGPVSQAECRLPV